MDRTSTLGLGDGLSFAAMRRPSMATTYLNISGALIAFNRTTDCDRGADLNRLLDRVRIILGRSLAAGLINNSAVTAH